MHPMTVYVSTSKFNKHTLFLWVKMIELGLVDGNLIDELMELTAQSLADLEIQEHFNIIKEIGRGKYGKVLLVTHRFKGNTLFFSLHPRYVFLDRLEVLFPLK